MTADEEAVNQNQQQEEEGDLQRSVVAANQTLHDVLISPDDISEPEFWQALDEFINVDLPPSVLAAAEEGISVDSSLADGYSHLYNRRPPKRQGKEASMASMETSSSISDLPRSEQYLAEESVRRVDSSLAEGCSASRVDSSLADGYSRLYNRRPPSPSRRPFNCLVRLSFEPQRARPDVTETIRPTTDTSPSNCQSWLNLRFTVGLWLLVAFSLVIHRCLVLVFFASGFTALFTLIVCILGAGHDTFMLYLASRRATFSSWWLSYRISKKDGSTLG